MDELLSEITPKEQERVAIKMRIAARIADALEERGMQKKELAASCELKGSSMVTKWLSGGHNFTVDTLVDISFALGLTVADLVRPAENKVIFTRTVTVHLAALSIAPQLASGAALFAGRSSAIGSSTMVSEPVYRYGGHNPCLA